MTDAVLAAKAEALQRCLARIRATCPATAEALAGNIDAQDIVSVNLIRAVQLAVDMATHAAASLGLPPPTTMGESFERLVEGGRLDAELATTRLADLEALARALLRPDAPPP